MANGVAVPEMSARARDYGRRRPWILLGAIAMGLGVATVAATAVKGLPWAREGQTVELPLVARNLKFNGTNPRLEARVGDTIRLAVTNAEPPGIPHDLVITGPDGLVTRPIPPGQTQVVVFKPSRPGIYHYSCSLHPRLMDGEIVVRP